MIERRADIYANVNLSSTIFIKAHVRWLQNKKQNTANELQTYRVENRIGQVKLSNNLSTNKHLLIFQKQWN